MKKTFLIVIAMLSFLWGNAQKNLTGYYKFPDTNGDGLGGSSLALFENRKFVLVAYATLVVGKWDVENDVTLVLNPENPANSLQVFARNNPELKAGAQIIFNGIENNEIYFGAAQNAMKRVFNNDANCFDSPYILNEKSIAGTYFIADLENPENRKIFSFSTKNYNQFVIKYVDESQFFPPMMFDIVKNGLKNIADLKSPVAKKNPLPTKGEEAEFLKTAVQKFNQTNNEEFVLLNTDFRLMNGLENAPNLSNYQFNTAKNRYEAKVKHDEPNEYLKRDVLFKFEKVKLEDLPLQAFKPLKGSVFNAKCTEDNN